MLNIKLILNTVGKLLFVEGIFLLLSLFVSLYYSEIYTCKSFLYTSCISFVIGGLLTFYSKDFSQEVSKRDGYFIVSIVWIVFSIIGTLPFILSGSISNFTDAFFETMSGFSTTGASILSEIESLPKGILFWRSFTHLVGGMGILVLGVAVLPFLGIGGMQLFNSESFGVPGDKLHPRIKQTARRLWGIYISLVLIETVFLMFGGMNFFNSLCHSFATIASGGFSTFNSSAMEMSTYHQYVLILFMVFAGINFTLFYCALKGRFKSILINQEFKTYIVLIIASTALIVGLMFYHNSAINFEQAFRDVLFQVVSIITCTGFVSSDFWSWGHNLWVILFILMFTGACVGSTCGGVKIFRYRVLYKSAGSVLKRMLHPKAIIPVRYNKKAISESVVYNILGFVLVYIATFVIGSVILTISDLDFISSIGAVATCMGGIGPGLNKVGPVENFSAISDFGKYLLSFLMLLGRLELFPVLVLFTSAFWKDI